MCVHGVDMSKIVPPALGRLRLILVATSERKLKKEQVFSRTFEGDPLQKVALEQLFCFVGMHDTVDKLTVHSALATGLGVEIQSLEVPNVQIANAAYISGALLVAGKHQQVLHW